MKKMIKILPFLLTFLLFFAGSANALDKYYLLQKGNTAADEGRNEKAVAYYQDYIQSHPATSGVHSDSYHRKMQYYIRNLLIAYSNLLDLYRENGNAAGIEKWIAKLKGTYQSNRFGSKNMYTLVLIYLDSGFAEDAVTLLKKIIREQKNNYNPYNNKVVLRAFSKLAKIYASQGEEEKLATLIVSLQSNYPNADFDLKDRYKLAALYIKYGQEVAGEELLKKIIHEAGIDPDPSDVNVLIRTYVKLLHICQKKNDEKTIDGLVKQISRRHPPWELSCYNIYKLAIAYLKCGKQKEGAGLLVKIADEHPYALYARKALFVLGRVSQADQEWDAAIKYYSEYIERYPDPPFFALKAYSRLIDVYWSRDSDTDLVQQEITKLADTVNNISDFETRLNLARDLKRKGMDGLASATFSLGLSAAEKYIAGNRDTYKALRANWIIEKYAWALDKFDLVEKRAENIFKIAGTLENGPLTQETHQKIEYIKSQTYLWLGKVCQIKGNLPEAAKLLKRFIKNYPDQKEIDYARYELGRIYENSKQENKAIHMYKAVEESMWKQKAQKRMLRLLLNRGTD